MIGFKKTPTRLVFSLFFISIILILLIYLDYEDSEIPQEETIYEQESVVTPTEKITNNIIHNVKDGENISIIFESYKIPLNTAYKIFRKDDKGLLTKILPGDQLKFKFVDNNLNSIEIKKNKIDKIIIEVKDEILIYESKAKVEKFINYQSGNIETSFYQSAIDSGIPESIIMDLAYIFGWDIDFILDIRNGDSFYIAYETSIAEGEVIESPDILIAKFVNQTNEYFAVRYFTKSGDKNYYDLGGSNMQKAFLRAPLDFSRISSHFNPNRRHPILHTIRAHKGTDYAAATGTPVQATGDGTISFIGVKNGCGNEILIKHANDYRTRYCHLNKFASKLKKGSKVKQGDSIGYVGSSGLATGPHLHYEFMIGNKHTDPVRVKFPSAEPVPANEIMSFNEIKDKYMLELSKTIERFQINE